MGQGDGIQAVVLPQLGHRPVGDDAVAQIDKAAGGDRFSAHGRRCEDHASHAVRAADIFCRQEPPGLLHGPEAEARGCGKPWNFSSWQPDIVCIRLMTNDNNGMNERRSFETDRETVIRGGMKLIRKVRKHNARAKIVWVLPGTDCHPELAAEAVKRMQEEGFTDLYTFTLPDYGPGDLGARWHPNAEWNRMAGELLGSYLKTIV